MGGGVAASAPHPPIALGSNRSSAPTSPAHRDQSADGCPSAALLDEIVRRPTGTKDVFTDEILATADDIAAHLDPKDPDAARTDALTLLGVMVGTLQLSRALTNRDQSDQLLARGVETALKLIDERVPSMRLR